MEWVAPSESGKSFCNVTTCRGAGAYCVGRFTARTACSRRCNSLWHRVVQTSIRRLPRPVEASVHCLAAARDLRRGHRGYEYRSLSNADGRLPTSSSQTACDPRRETQTAGWLHPHAAASFPLPFWGRAQSGLGGGRGSVAHQLRRDSGTQAESAAASRVIGDVTNWRCGSGYTNMHHHHRACHKPKLR